MNAKHPNLLFSSLLIGLFTSITFQVFPQITDFPFTENKGQWHSQVKFRSLTSGGQVFLLEGGWSYVAFTYQEESGLATKSVGEHSPHPIRTGGHIVVASLLGANDVQTWEKTTPSAFDQNFILGKKEHWAKQVKAFKEVERKEVYEGISARFYFQNGNFKYDWKIQPGATAENIQWNYEGQDQLFLRSGHLVLTTSAGEIIEHSPYAYQVIKGKKVEVPCEFQLDENQVASFVFPEGYDTSKELIIDPELIFSTYSGSVSDNWGFTATYDSLGYVYAGGIIFDNETLSIPTDQFPFTPGAFQTVYGGGNSDISILKYTPDGADLVFATYFGGDSTDVPMSTVVNSKGELVILSVTGSANFPVVETSVDTTFNGGVYTRSIGGLFFRDGSDMGVSILSPDGTELIGSTFLGGSGNDGLNFAPDSTRNISKLNSNYGDEFRSDIILDKEDNIFVVSQTQSDDFPVSPTAFQPEKDSLQDVIIAKLSPNVSELQWATFFGGEEYDGAYSVKLDSLQNLIFSGGTRSHDLPFSSNAYQPNFMGGRRDGYLAKISADGSTLLAGTYIGTDTTDQVHLVDLDLEGNIYAFGQTYGDYPISENTFNNPLSGQFIHSFDANLENSRFSTLFGTGATQPDIVPTAFMVDNCGNIHLAGWGGNTNRGSGYIGGTTTGLPVTPNAFQSETDGSDFYLMSLSPNAEELLFATFLGAPGGGDHVDGGTSRFSPDGTIYQSVCSCGTTSFPTTEGVWSNTNSSANCNIATFKFDLEVLKSDFTSSTTAGCPPLSVTFENKSIGADQITWTLENGETISGEEVITRTFEDPGTYVISLVAEGKFSCVPAISSDTVVVYPIDFPGIGITPNQRICIGDAIDLTALGGSRYEWFDRSEEELIGTSSVVTVSPRETQWYDVIIYNEFDCSETRSVQVEVFPQVEVDFDALVTRPCGKSPELIVNNRSTENVNYSWSIDDGDFQGSGAYQLSPYFFQKEGNFNLRLEVSNQECEAIQEILVEVDQVYPPNVFTPSDGQFNQTLDMTVDTQGWQLVIVNRWGKEIYRDINYKNDWDGAGFPAGVYFYHLTSPDGHSCRGWFHKM